VSTAAIVDIDGTLVDSNYQHTIAWARALREHDCSPPLWRIHRHIGMGGDKLVEALAGPEFDRRAGDEVREAEGRAYAELVDEVQPLAGARELLTELRKRGHAVILASSAKEDEVDRYLDMLDARELVHGWTTSADVEATKPEPDLVAAALRKAEALSAVMVGDTTWDVEAAARAELKTVAVLTGGFAEAELREAGAVDVFDSVVSLRAGLDGTPLR
jgi:HAD superfamily hydrolase (TIGR01509 family)